MAEKTRKVSILLAEDEGIVAKDIANTLRNMGYEVTAIVSSGNEAVKKALELAPDLVLMDIGLEGDTDGILAAMEIKNRMHIPVIYLTAYSDDVTLQRAKVTEPYGYILKPFEERELYTSVEMALYKHQMEKRLRDSEEWLSTILRNIGDAVIATDKEGRVRFMNPLAREITGCTQLDTIDLVSQEAFGGIGGVIKPLVEESLSTGRSTYSTGMEYRGITGRNYVIDISTSALMDNEKITGSVITIRDVTEKKILKDKVRTLEKKGISLTEKDKQVLYGLIRYPEGNDIALSKKLSVKRSTFTGIRNKLEKEGFIKTIRVPNMSRLGYELLTVSYCSFSGGPQEAAAAELFEQEAHCPEFFHAITTATEHCSFAASRNITEYMEKTDRINRQYDRRSIMKEGHTVYLPYRLTNVLSFFDYSRPVKKWFKPEAEDQEPQENSRKEKREKSLTDNEGMVLYAITKYPDLPDKALAKKTSLNKITVSQIKKRLIEEKYVETLRIPALKKIGCELVLFMHGKLNPEIDRKTRHKFLCEELCPATYIEGPRDAVLMTPFKDYTEYKTVYDTYSQKQEENILFLEDPKTLLIPTNKITGEKLNYAPLAKAALSIEEDI
jgi:PAS domain S-box-containing protein